jgi:sec-independent protein translocase protein TatA
MDFLGFGGWEILLIVIVALLVFGPGKMIQIARSLGKMVYNFKKIASEMTNQLTKELDEQKKLDELKKDEATNPENNPK